MANFLTSALLRFVCNHILLSDVALAMLGLFIFSCVRERLSNKGPMMWPVLGLIPTVMVNMGRAYDWATAALTAAGGTFAYRGMWLGGAHGILTVDPANIEYMLRTKSFNFPKGSYYRERFRDLLGAGIFNADGEDWRRQRRVAASEMHSGAFHRFSAETMESLVQNKLLVFLEKIAKSGGSVDLQDLLLRFTFDNICAAALGFDSGCLDVDLPEIPFARAFEEATELTLYRFLVPPFVWKPMRRLGIGFERRLARAARFVRGFADRTVKERRTEIAGNKTRSDLLSRLMGIELEGERFSDEFLSDFCISFILAGRDTSSVGLAWFFWLVQNNPDVERRIMAEIGTVLLERNRSRASVCGESGVAKEAVFSEEEVKKMTYLEAAVTESLRLFPPVPVDMKEALEDDVFPDGTAVKRGARVLYCMFAMARTESIWGRDCREFRPDRWIDDETGRLVAESQFKYAVFNGGPRLCLGKSFAYLQMKMVAANILSRYQIRVLEGQRIVPKVTTTLYMKNGMLVRFKPRLLSHQRE